MGKARLLQRVIQSGYSRIWPFLWRILFLPRTVGRECGVTPLAPELPLEMPTKKHRQGTDRRSIKTQGQQFQNTSSEEKSKHSTPLLSHDAVPKASGEDQCSLFISSVTGLAQWTDVLLMEIPGNYMCFPLAKSRVSISKIADSLLELIFKASRHGAVKVGSL